LKTSLIFVLDMAAPANPADFVKIHRIAACSQSKAISTWQTLWLLANLYCPFMPLLSGNVQGQFLTTLWAGTYT